MEKNLYVLKRMLAVLLISLMLSMVIIPITQAYYTDNMNVGEEYKYTGLVLTTYKDKDGAKKGNILKISGLLFINQKFTIKEIDGNIIKIGDKKFINCTKLTSSKFKLVGGKVQNQQPAPTPTPAPEPEPEPVKIPVTKVVITKTDVTLNKGEKLQLEAIVMPENATNKTITWASDNSTVVSVSAEGMITAKAGGTAIITATADGVSETCKVTVEVPITKISLNKETAKIEVKKTLTLKPTILPDDATNKKIIWSSSDKTIATVKDGKVTAVKQGNVTITATTANGKSEKCKITVVQSATGIAIDNAISELEIGKSVELKATIKPSNTTDKTVTWISSDEKIATVSTKGKVKGIKAGEVTITAKTENGKTAKCIITIRDPYEYKFNNKTYRIAVRYDKLNSVLNTIKAKGVYQDNGWKEYGSYNNLSCTNKKCYRIALCHVDMLLDDNVEKNIVHSGYNKGSYSTYYQNKGGPDCYWTSKTPEIIKNCIDQGKPVIIHTYSQSESEHWVAAVGYKGNGYSMNDLLFISCTDGVLCVNNQIDVNGHHSDQRFKTLAK